jgi:hypothetical protein
MLLTSALLISSLLAVINEWNRDLEFQTNFRFKVLKITLSLMKASQVPELNRGLPAAVVSLSEQVKRISLDSKR